MKAFVILLAVRFILATDEEEYIYHTPVGDVKCSREVIEGKPYRKCAHIKYAEVEERFGDSKLVPPNKNSAHPINEDSSPICYQPNNTYADNTRPISEDCLYLHVFVPLNCESTEPLPVMLYIHGGGYATSNGPIAPNRLVKKDVIVVTFNYRLGIFGFLSTGTCECSGNAGLKDSLLALQWVNTNIASFGGDPNNVVLYGFSAGAGMASTFPFIPSACGLFHGIILESGSFNAPWAFIPQQDAMEHAIEVGQKAGCDLSDPEKLCSCLKQLSAVNLLEATERVLGAIDMLTFNVFRWLPTAENPECSNSILTQSPQHLLTKHHPTCKVKIMIGVTQEEACIFQQNVEQMKQYLAPITSFAYKLAPKCLLETNNYLCMSHVTKEMAAHYAKNDRVFNEKNILPVISTVQMILPIMIYANLMTKCGCETYVYEFAYVGPCSMSQSMFPGSNLSCHADMFKYIFKTKTTQMCDLYHGSPNDDKISNILSELYSNFATLRHPALPDGLKWPVWTVDAQDYLELDIEPEIKQGLQNREMAFWKNLQDKCFVDDSGSYQNCCSTCPMEYTPSVL